MVLVSATQRTVAILQPELAAQGGQRDQVPRLLRQLRSEEHTSELQSLMRNLYAVFCLNKKKNNYKSLNDYMITLQNQNKNNKNQNQVPLHSNIVNTHRLNFLTNTLQKRY